MAKESVAIIQEKINVDMVLRQLNMALAEEWLSFYQYWVGANVIKGAMRSDVQREFLEHANEEFNHAKLLAERITQLEGTPLLNPQQWFEHAACAYEEPEGDFESSHMLRQNILSERCAIKRYQEIARLTDGKDFTTCEIAKLILAEEESHEQELQDFMDDISMLLHTTCEAMH